MASTPMFLSGTERGIRYAAYLIGGFVSLAIGVQLSAMAIGQLLLCEVNSLLCFNGGYFYYTFGSELGGGVALLVIAVVLLLWARSTGRTGIGTPPYGAGLAEPPTHPPSSQS